MNMNGFFVVLVFSDFIFFFLFTARRNLACCSPDCDWLLDYLEIDSTVVKCLDRK